MSAPESNGSHASDPASTSLRSVIANRKLSSPVHYHTYLCLDAILDAQKPKSADVLGTPAHDEHLFIIIHQVYELWFKQILFEIDSIREIFSAIPVDERLIGVAVSRLARVREIQTVLLQQINVIETMAPMDFLDFRDFLFPASGFQSAQFRLVENKLGLRPDARLSYGGRGYCTYLAGEEAAKVAAAEAAPSLYDLVEAWLERTPFLSLGTYDFWREYQAAVNAMLDEDESVIRANTAINEEAKEGQVKELQAQREHFASLFDAEKHDALRKRGDRRLSHRATQAALLIQLYQEEPILQLPYRLLNLLTDIDEQLTAWRYRHALMVHRQIGVRMGTGGSSGYHYLRATAERHKIFTDLTNLSTFLIPRTMLPQLPPDVRAELSFAFSPGTAAAVVAAATAPEGVKSPAAGSVTTAAAVTQAFASHTNGTGGAPVRCPFGHGQ